MEKLAEEPVYGIKAKRNRNMFLARLLTAMQEQKLEKPFDAVPPRGKLANALRVFDVVGERSKVINVFIS